MEAMLIKSRYKVTHVLGADKDYAAFCAVDLESRDKEEYLLNVYEGGLIKRYVDCYDRLRHCPEYRGMFLTQGALVAVFSLTKGPKLDQVFVKGAAIPWGARLAFAQLLFHRALAMSDFPPEISCAAFFSENIMVWLGEEKMAVNYMVRPLEGMNGRELALLCVDQAKKLLPKGFSCPGSQIEFMERLDSGEITTAAGLYSLWCQYKEKIALDWEEIEKKPAITRWLYLAAAKLSRWFKGLLGKKRGKRG